MPESNPAGNLLEFLTPVDGRNRTVADTLAGSILNSLRVLHRLLREEGEGVQRATGLSLAQVFVLRLLVERPRSLADLADATLADVPSTAVVTRSLEAHGLVARRHEVDGRELIAATDAGRSRIATVDRLVQPHLIESLREMDPTHRVHLDIGLRSWLEHLGHWNDHPAMFGESAPDHPRDDRRTPSRRAR